MGKLKGGDLPPGSQSHTLGLVWNWSDHHSGCQKWTSSIAGCHESNANRSVVSDTDPAVHAVRFGPRWGSNLPHQNTFHESPHFWPRKSGYRAQFQGFSETLSHQISHLAWPDPFLNGSPPVSLAMSSFRQKTDKAQPGGLFPPTPPAIRITYTAVRLITLSHTR